MKKLQIYLANKDGHENEKVRSITVCLPQSESEVYVVHSGEQGFELVVPDESVVGVSFLDCEDDPDEE